VTGQGNAHLAREARKRIDIDQKLATAASIVQGGAQANVGAALGVAVREFALEEGHGQVDYALSLHAQPAGCSRPSLKGRPWSRWSTRVAATSTGHPAGSSPRRLAVEPSMRLTGGIGKDHDAGRSD
jgi:hypothetical protein